MGGGPDVDAAFRWLIDRAGGRDVLVLRVSGTDGYNASVRRPGEVDSVETLAVRSLAAPADSPVVGRVQRAEARSVAGDNQAVGVSSPSSTTLARRSAAILARR